MVAHNQTTTVENGVATAFKTAQKTVQRSLEEYEENIRESPRSALLCAMAFGYFLRLIPLGAILAGLGRLFAAIAKPAILLFGAAKMYEFLQAESSRVSEGDDDQD